MAKNTLPLSTPLTLAVVGAGPVGLALALLAAERLPQARITLWDARDAEADIHNDPRTLALSLGSIQLLRRLQAWPADRAQTIQTVHVSQTSATQGLVSKAAVMIHAKQEKLDMLGAVIRYGELISALQKRWFALVQQQPGRFFSRFGTPVSALLNLPHSVQVHAAESECFDWAVLAEGSVLAPKHDSVLTPANGQNPLRCAYQQTAWVGQLELQNPHRGVAYECFGQDGPVAVLPLKDSSERLAALVWCVKAAPDPIAELNDSQRVQQLNSLLHAQMGPIRSISPLKHFPLGFMAYCSLTEGRTVRIGNAAQMLHPVAGQGLNLGLRDAYALVDKLRHRRPDEAVKQLEWQRGPDRWALLATTDFLARSFAWQIPGAPTIRGLGLMALEGLPLLKSALARHMMFGRR